jgi:hypothetical protein
MWRQNVSSTVCNISIFVLVPLQGLSRAQTMDFCPAKSKTFFSPRQKSADFCPRHPVTADNCPASLLFT